MDDNYIATCRLIVGTVFGDVLTTEERPVERPLTNEEFEQFLYEEFSGTEYIDLTVGSIHYVIALYDFSTKTNKTTVVPLSLNPVHVWPDEFWSEDE